ncbi:MAG: hypothetical protein ACRDSR_14090 [Pseudonocardiaceae bacterium]
MVDAVMKVLTVVVVVLLILVLIPLLGPFVTNQMPEFAESVSRILNATWDGIQRLLHSAGFSYGSGYSGH